MLVHLRSECIHLYQPVQECYPSLTHHLAEQGRGLLGYDERGFEDCLSAAVSETTSCGCGASPVAPNT